VPYLETRLATAYTDQALAFAADSVKIFSHVVWSTRRIWLSLHTWSQKFWLGPASFGWEGMLTP